MMIADSTGTVKLFATHPPIIDRIKAFDPGFQESELPELARKCSSDEYAPEAEEVLSADGSAAVMY